MTMKHQLFYSFALLCSLFFVACSGEDGRDGEDGNANVIASPWIASGFSNNSGVSASFSYDDPMITSELAESAVFLVYGRQFSIGGTNVISQLPLVLDGKSYYFELFPDTQQVWFRGRSADNNTSYSFNDFSEFRYIIIPAPDPASKIQMPNFQKMTYGEVVAHFGLDY